MPKAFSFEGWLFQWRSRPSPGYKVFQVDWLSIKIKTTAIDLAMELGYFGLALASSGFLYSCGVWTFDGN
ncbi:MAG: hypothetical protein LBT47_11030 [Deltaproteobacteria bacterium]|jgi:hypothetical protein|nr:hypothetical protein [Deltaproteobacteria bacterium]